MTRGPARRCSTAARPAQGGLGALAALMVLVVLAMISAAILRLGQAGTSGFNQDLMGERASQAARAGVEWGLYQAFKGSWTTCAGASQTLDLSADSGLRVTVSCNSATYNEGESAPGVPKVLRSYVIDAVACSSATACPDAGVATQANYVERRRQVQATN